MLSWVPNRTALGDPLAWDAADLPLEYVIQDAGSDDIADGSHAYAIRSAFEAWGSQPGSSLTVLEDADPASTARTDWEADDIHLVLFDEIDSSGLFPFGSGLVALTVYQYETNTGRLLDGDILLNGFEQDFATDLPDDAFDVRAAVTHEVGHLIGLAHSPLGGATMAPFLGKGRFQKRSLALDDIAAVGLLYPGGTKGELTGVVTHNGLPVQGAHVWCSGGNGIVATSTLSEADGSFVLGGLDPNDYRVIAAPLDSPITPELLAAEGLATPDLFFRQTSVSVFSILGAESIDVGALAVGDDSALTILSPVNSFVVERDQTLGLALEVAGVVGGTPTVSVPSSGSLSVENVVFDGGSTLTFDVVVPAGTPPGLYDLQVETAIGTRTSHAGFLEIVPKAPTINLFSPTCGGSIGAQEVFLSGTNLASTTEFVFGGAAGTLTAVGAGGGTVAGFPPLHGPGTVDVVVVTAAGAEARVDDAYTFVDGGIPVLDTVFPPAGDELGGTTLTLTGDGFGLSSAVFFNATPAASTTLVDAGTLTAVTPALAVGDYVVTVANLGCEANLNASLVNAFSAVTGGDPTVDLVAPSIVSQAGNEAITVTGTGFVNGATVFMSADPLTGLGGTDLATSFVNATQLDATTPAGPLLGGPASIGVRLPSGQSDILDDAVQVDAPELLSVTPEVFAQTGGLTLTITGTGFVPGGVVELFTDLDDFTGGTPLDTTFVSGKQVTAEVPTSLSPLRLGTDNVSITFPGPLLAGKFDAITIVAASLDAVEPDEIDPAGGETLTLTGFGFTPGASARLFADDGNLTGGVALATTFVSGTELSVETPVGPLLVGAATIAIDLAGSVVAGLVGGVEVLPPRLDGASPSQLDPSGGQTLTLSGFGFTPSAAVRLFADPVDLTGGTSLATTFISSVELEVVTPAGPLPAGAATLAIDQPGAPIVGLVGGVVVLPPELTSVAPDELNPAGDEQITLTGFGFTPGAVVRLFVDPGDLTGGVELSTTFVSDTELTAVTPPGPLAPGVASIAIDQPPSPTVGLVGGVEVVASRLDSVTPSQLIASGGESITLAGYGFSESSVVRLFADPGDFTGGTVLDTVFVSSTTLTAETPQGPLPGGFATVAIDQDGVDPIGLVDAVEILFPVIDSVDPALVDFHGGTTITVIGQHFSADAVVELFTDPITLDGGIALATTFVDAGTLDAVIPEGPHALGPASVAVRMPNEVVVVAAEGLEFVAAVDNGNKASGDLGDGDDEDLLVFDGIAGSEISAMLKRVGKNDLQPKLVLLDDEGTVLVSTDETDAAFDPDLVKSTDRAAVLRKVVLPETRRYVLRLTRVSGQGEYRFVYREKLPPEARKVKVTKQDAVVLGPATHELTFDAKAGTLLTGAFKGKKQDGLMLVLDRLEAPGDIVLLSTDDAGVVSGDPELVELVTLGKGLVSIKLKQVTLPAFGSYRLVLAAADGTSGSLTGSAKLVPAKVKASFEEL